MTNSELVVRFDRWLLLQKYSPITRDMYRRAMREYARFLGAKSVIKSTHLDVQEYLAQQAAKGVLPRTVLYKLYAVRVFFDFLCLGGLIKWSPPRVVQMKKVERCVPSVLTVDQVRRVFRAARTPHERALVEVLYGTGCRTGEVRTMLIATVLAIPFSTTPASLPTHVSLPSGLTGLQETSTLQPESIQTVRKEQLVPIPGTRTLGESVIGKLARGVLLSTGVQLRDIPQE